MCRIQQWSPFVSGLQAEISACQLFALYGSFRAAIKVGIVYTQAYLKVYVFRRLIFIASAYE